ncbi:MAG: glycosyltransferase family 9 protein [Candidatus Edwardsbacteria bacterium]|nr:glycosyltransferase family 9 protein [Candidatus Edwardsbacteria bacterium]
MRNGKRSEPPSSVLLFVWGGIGNMVMALPMLSAIRKRRPDDEVAVVVEKGVMAELLVPGRYAAVVALDDPLFQELPGKIRLIKKLRSLKPATFLSSVPWPIVRYKILARLSGAKKALTLPGGKRALRNNYHRDHRSNIENNLMTLGQLGIGGGQRIPELPSNLPDMAFAGTFLRESGIERGRGIVGLHPGAGDPKKRFSENIFIELGRNLVARGCGAVVAGGREEQPLKQRVAREIGKGAISTPPHLRLGQTLGLIDSCKLFISNDSGLAHCSAALGVPTIALFGPTDHRISGPAGRLVGIITSRTGCRPCYYPGKRPGCSAKDQPCLRLTFDEFRQQLDENLRVFFA